MRKLVYLLLLSIILLLTACTEQTSAGKDKMMDGTSIVNGTKVVGIINEASENQSDPASSIAVKTALDGYDEIMSEKLVSPEEMLIYIRGNIGIASPDKAANLVQRLEELQKVYIETLNEKYNDGESVQSEFAKLYIDGNIPNNPDNVKNAALRKLLTDVRNNGFKTETAEGSFFPVIDYSIYSEFQTYLPEDIVAYFSLMAVESGQKPASDGELVISWDEVVNRALTQQQFIISYNQSQKLSEVQVLYDKYISYIFGGLPNTPDFSYDTKIFSSELKTSLLTVSEKNGNTLLKKTIRDYLDVLSRSQDKLTNEVEKFRKNAAAALSKT